MLPGHKSTLASPGKKSMLSGSTCNCNLPNLTIHNQMNIHFPNPTREYLTGHLIPAHSPDTCCQIIDFKSYQN